MSESIRVAVIGAGIAGLTAAYRLVQRGFEVAIFDERVHVGGKMGAHRARMFSTVLPRKDSDALAYMLDTRATSGAEFNGESAPRGSPSSLPTLMRQLRLRLRVRRRLFNPGAPSRTDAIMLDRLRVERVDPPTHGAEREWRIEGPDTGLQVTLSRYVREDNEPNWEISDGVDHEHCYHMYLNWYRNFWQLMEDIGCDRSDCFRRESRVSHLLPGAGPVSKRTRTANRQGALDAVADTLTSGLAPIPDTFLWMHSFADVAGRRFNPGAYLDQESVHGFMSSRWYATERSVRRHEHVLSKAFAIPTYLSSGAAYRNFAAFSAFEPDPMLWVMKGNSYKIVFSVFEKVLASKKKPDGEAACKLELGTWITKLIRKGPGGRVNGLEFEPSDMRGWPRRLDDGERPRSRSIVRRKARFKPDYVILAVPPRALAKLVEPFRDEVPGLADVRKLQSGVTAALDLYFRKRIDLDIPDHHVLAIGSKYGLTFIDNSQCWDESDGNLRPNPGGDGKCTCLNVAATDFSKLEGMSKDEATRAIIEDLKHFLPFDDEDIDESRTYLQMNDGEPLFVNEVGSEPWRPEAFTDIPNLFLAGDFCANDINAVSVEGAVMTGLLAARAVQARVREDFRLGASDPRMDPIPIEQPEVDPAVNMQAFKLMLSPYAAAMKVWSNAEEFTRHPERALTPSALQGLSRQWLAAPGALAEDWINFVGEGAHWIANLPRGE